VAKASASRGADNGQVTETTIGSWALAAGEHVCWRAASAHDFAAGRDALSAHADRCAGGLIILDDESAMRGAIDGASVTAVPRTAANALTAVRERVHEARRGGRVPWVLAPMERLASPDALVAEIVAIELELAELAADTETGVVCAYQAPLWKPTLLGDIAAVHSRVLGIRPSMSGFRLRPIGAHGYALEGSVGFESLRAFTSALRGALLRTPDLRLGCERLELIDAAAWRALIETVVATPGTSVLLEGANEVVRGTWALSGYGGYGAAVQVRS
jgi:hypothetical protein